MRGFVWKLWIFSRRTRRWLSRGRRRWPIEYLPAVFSCLGCARLAIFKASRRFFPGQPAANCLPAAQKNNSGVTTYGSTVGGFALAAWMSLRGLEIMRGGPQWATFFFCGAWSGGLGDLSVLRRSTLGVRYSILVSGGLAQIAAGGSQRTRCPNARTLFIHNSLLFGFWLKADR